MISSAKLHWNLGKSNHHLEPGTTVSILALNMVIFAGMWFIFPQLKQTTSGIIFFSIAAFSCFLYCFPGQITNQWKVIGLSIREISMIILLFIVKPPPCWWGTLMVLTVTDIFIWLMPRWLAATTGLLVNFTVGSLVWWGSFKTINPFETIQSLALGNMISMVLGFSIVRLSKMHGKAANQAEQSREAAAKLAEANVQLQNYALRIEDFTLMEERARVSRELHDTLAHTMISLVVKLGLCEDMIATEPEQLAIELKDIRERIRKCLDEVRTVVSTLRSPLSDEGKGNELWQRLITTFAQTTGVETYTRILGDFSQIDDSLNHVIYRIIQEGMTNAYRHGHASIIDIAVSWEEAFICIRIADNGKGVEFLKEGNGLTGIRERVEALGGQIAWISQPGVGFDLGVVLSARGGVSL